MNFLKVITLSLGDFETPVLTQYELGVLVQRLNLLKEYKGEPIDDLPGSIASLGQFKKVLHELEKVGVLSSYPGFTGSVYSLLGRKINDAEEIACSVDPFCYLSHLSAMAHHGLTNRIPIKIFVSSPDPKSWKAFATERMQKDLKGDFAAYQDHGLPLLTRIKMEKIGRREVHRFGSSHLGAYKNVRGKVLRVSTLGRTFLDMLRNPELCGGIHHVIEVYEEHAKTYQQLIVNELDQHGSPIDKIRAGYILEEKMKLQDGAFENWLKFAQRGGSRKLDASGEYFPKWSDKWCLSLNL